ncbi:unnamed protein product [Dibothriocephalus latus]|uniref:Uncharacterized protein n=1 Tax=Dibothriocephalus latus TaxID=60516 RepID=A0A3P7P6V9_DIBLA|nr:unnamed protein product [Dibothriocephalus latus]
MTTRLDIEPHTGVILKAEKQLQVNGVVRRNADFPSLRRVHDTFFPIGFFKESFVIPDDIAAKLRNSLLPLLISKIIAVCLIVIPSVGLAIVLLVFLMRRRPVTELVVEVSEADDQTPLMADTA